jgi:Arc/MetJ-type ribon-helix-helix transcriptional regulator
MAKVRLNIEISENLADFLDALAESEHTTRSEMVRRAIAVLQAFHQQRGIGRPHLGFVRDPERLDAEILGVLQPTATSAPTPPPRIAPAPTAPAVQTESLSPAPVSIFSESGPVSMEAAMSRWSPHVGGR